MVGESCPFLFVSPCPHAADSDPLSCAGHAVRSAPTARTSRMGSIVISAPPCKPHRIGCPTSTVVCHCSLRPPSRPLPHRPLPFPRRRHPTSRSTSPIAAAAMVRAADALLSLLAILLWLACAAAAAAEPHVYCDGAGACLSCTDSATAGGSTACQAASFTATEWAKNHTGMGWNTTCAAPIGQWTHWHRARLQLQCAPPSPSHPNSDPLSVWSVWVCFRSYSHRSPRLHVQFDRDSARPMDRRVGRILLHFDRIITMQSNRALRSPPAHYGLHVFWSVSGSADPGDG